jgi:hypothetical protein
MVIILDSSKVLELNRKEDLNRPFSLCGRRCYLIGHQNGLFPDIGSHRIGEMGGVWTHPIKIVDGFWMSLTTRKEAWFGYSPRMRRWFRKCDEFVLGDGGAWVEHRYNLPKFTVSRKEYVPYNDPALGIEVNITPKDKSVKTALLNFLVRFDIKPVWFSGWPDPVYLEAETKDNMVVVHSVSGDNLPYTGGRWTAALKSDVAPKSITCGERLWGPEKTVGNGISCLLKFQLDFNPDANVRMVLAGDCEGEERALGTLNKVLYGYDSGLQRKIEHYRSVAYDSTVIDTPEKILNDAFLWSKLNLEWLTQTSPYVRKNVGDEWLIFKDSPYVGTCVVAGHQDYTSYFGCDTETSIPGILAAGLHETAKQSLRLLGYAGKRQNGQIPHEIVSNGEIYAVGHIGESTGFLKSVWDTYLWSGDEAFLKEMYPLCKLSMDYVLKQPSMDGIILRETEDRPGGGRRAKQLPPVVDFEAFAEISKRVNNNEDYLKFNATAKEMRRQIDELFWIEEEELYAAGINENNEPNGGNVEYTLGSVAYDMIGEKSKILRALSRHDEGYPFKMYEKVWPGFYMPIIAGFAAVGEFNYGRVEQGLRLMRTIAETVGHVMPGAIPETVQWGEPKKFQPGWNYLQLWSAAKVPQGLVYGLLRIEPDAARNKIEIRPQLPKDWPYAEFKNLIIGKSKINVRLEKEKTIVKQISGPKIEVIIKE